MSRHVNVSTIKIDENIENNMSSVFNVSDMPLNVLSDVKIQDVLDTSLDDQYVIWNTWKPYIQRDVTQLYKCENVVTGENIQNIPEIEKRTYDCVKFAFMAYTSPHLFLNLSPHIHESNYHFNSIMYQIVAQSINTSNRVMHQINMGQVKFLPTSEQVGGFYIRTPIKLWNRQGKRVYRLPSYNRRQELVNYKVEGNVNSYVTREPILNEGKSETFRLRISFRGTSNDFNGIPQYGKNFSNTQVYSVPSFDPIENKVYPCGSSSVPLLMSTYVDLVRNVWPHIKQCLKWLRVDSEFCEEVVVTGHSMGGAMTIVLNYLLYTENIEWWKKFYFVAIGAPTCANHKAVEVMEQRCIDMNTPYKVIEVINDDDFVNMHYKLGDRQGVEKSISCGIVHTIAWLLKYIFEDNENENFFHFEKKQRDNILLRLMREHTNELASSFVNGVFHGQYQTSTSNPTVGTRMGYRRSVRALWGTAQLNTLVNNTFALLVCKRFPNYHKEYIGKSHVDYLYTSFYTAWKHTRLFEDRHYYFLRENSLRHHSNRLKIIPFMSTHEQSNIQRKVKQYIQKLSK